MRRRTVLPALTLALALAACGGVRDDLSARDQELCEIAFDDDQSIGFLSGEVDELIENDGAFSSEGDAFAFQQVPVTRSERDLSARIANYDEPDSAGYIDDEELLDSAKDLRDVLFDLQVAADEASSIDTGTLDSVRSSIDDLKDVCTG
jgi:hypothetical protein